MALYPFQKQAIADMRKFLHSTATGSTYNACEPGLGKTRQVLEVLKEEKCKKSLIICPAIARLVWDDEIAKWTNFENTQIIETLKTPVNSDANTLVTSYDIARNINFINQIKHLKFDAVIYDEAHALKSTNSQNTKNYINTYNKLGERKILMSGTPMMTQVTDLYPVLSTALPEYFSDWDAFTSRYCYKRWTGWEFEYYGFKNTDELKDLVRKEFLVRYTKQQVFPEMPLVTHQLIHLSEKLSLDYDITDTDKRKILECIEQGRELPKGTLAEKRRLQGQKKIKSALDFIAPMLESGQKLVVFAFHLNVIKELENALSKYKPLVVTGNTSPADRRSLAQDFQDPDRERNLFLGQIIAAGVSITLTASCTVVIIEPDWSPSVVKQAVERVHRIGQTRPVTAYYLVVKNSLDESIMNALLKRAWGFNKVLEGG